ncbi:unnamed protein product [Ranitomeya imitator]|uniref:Cysteine sulfinic acid decarboxylase n=1 Tax=Ranitomeya imitator TaxID=111125 RepID=A0ABN9LJM4_9NEOB|nr:unnamed protein product [Ranitomeya imitator]
MESDIPSLACQGTGVPSLISHVREAHEGNPEVLTFAGIEKVALPAQGGDLHKLKAGGQMCKKYDLLDSSIYVVRYCRTLLLVRLMFNHISAGFLYQEQSSAMARKSSSLQNDETGDEFLKEAFKIIMEEAVQKGTDRNCKVCEWMEPEELKRILDLSLRSEGEPQDVLLGYCKDIFRLSVKTGHPRFFNQLFSGLDRYALTGRMISEALNTSQYTYEVAPVFVLMEDEVLRTMRSFVGWKNGDGIFCPGGSISNMYALNVARFQRFPQCKEKGLHALPRLVVFTSQESHYSVQKGAAFLGIGTDNVILVETNERGKMISEDLEDKILKVKTENDMTTSSSHNSTAEITTKTHFTSHIPAPSPSIPNLQKLLILLIPQY